MQKAFERYMSIVEYLQKKGPADQACLSNQLDIGLMTVNKVVNHLLNSGLLVKAGKSDSQAGRKSDLYNLNPELCVSIGVALNEERALFSALRPDGEVITNIEYPFNVNNEIISSADNLLNLITKYYERFITEIKINEESIAILGIALEGIVDTENGRFILGTHLGGIIDMQLRDHVSRSIGLPVYIDDPCRAGAYYENKYRSDLTGKSFISIYIGKGVGSGIMIDGKLYRGFSGIAGEVGHMVVNDNGIRCKCGNYGCLETIASEESIVRQIREGIQEGVFTKILNYCDGDLNKVDLDVLKRAADDGDKFSLNIIEYVGNHLGKALALVVNFMNPEFIVIGGEGVKIGSFLENYVNRIINTNALNVLEKKTNIKINEYDRFRDAKSIATEALDSLLSDHAQGVHNIVTKKLLQILDD